MTTPHDLVRELTDARAEVMRAVDAVDPSSHATPGLIGDWSVRDLLAHLGYWAGHAVEAIHAAEDGRPGEHGLDDPPTDEINDTVVRVARQTPLDAVRKREAASFEALVTWLGRMEPTLLDVELGDGSTVEEAVRGDGVDHYREHADELRSVLQARRDA
jgi:hypothetical protein